MSEFDFVAALMELQANDPEGYDLVVETIHRLSEKQKEIIEENK
jgi:hypothetical protein